MNAPSRPGKLPLAVRNFSLLCMALSGLVGFLSLSELLSLVHLAEVSQSPPGLAGPFGSEAFKRGLEAQLSALESMRVARAVTLCGLGLACALNLVSASRLIWPRGWRRLDALAPALPREGMRRLVVASSVAVALLRTLDGAQLAVVARRVGAAMGRSGSIPGIEGASPADLEARLRSWAVAVAVLQTSAVVGAFAFFSHYFRTQRVRGALAALDHPP